ncbi:MAG TPA: hypothetical protein P5267_00500 [Patescibacteria group bacterium]|nr:hypothetical protein [Patescibacteria group bacterium]
MSIISDFKKHEEFIRQELVSHKSNVELKDLLNYHYRQIQNFQHERLIHLLVTLTYALANLIALGLTLAFASLGTIILNLILLVMLVFYIKHYFALENGVARLYQLDQAIMKRIN